MNDSHTITQFKNGTASELAAANPILAKAEMVLESDTNKIKFGDGETRYNLLPYINGNGAGCFKYGEYKLSAPQTTNLAQNQRVLFDTKANGSLPAPVNGVITLPAGKTYKMQFMYYAGYSTTSGYSAVFMYDITHSALIGMEASALNVGQPTTLSDQPTLVSFITTTEPTQIEARITTSVNLTSIDNYASRLIIEEYGGY